MEKAGAEVEIRDECGILFEGITRCRRFLQMEAAAMSEMVRLASKFLQPYYKGFCLLSIEQKGRSDWSACDAGRRYAARQAGWVSVSLFWGIFFVYTNRMGNFFLFYFLKNCCII